MNSILITGSKGFVGKHLIDKLRHEYEILQLDYSDGDDVVDPATWRKVPGAKVVIHLAAKSFVPDSWNNVSDFINCNVRGTIEALNYCKEHGSKLIFFSSYMYGIAEKLPIDENSEVKVNNPYALSKKMAEDVCKFYSDNFQVPVIILRPFNIFGFGQSENFLIPYLIDQIENNNEISVKDTVPRRDYVYIDDLTEVVRLAITYNSSSCEIFNIGSGFSHSVKDVIEILQNIFKKEISIHSKGERRKGEIMDTIANISKAKEKLMWTPRYTLQDGLEKIVKLKKQFSSKT